MRRKVKIELQDEDGTRYTLALEGSLSREKVMKVMDLLELMELPIDHSFEKTRNQNTSFGKIQALIETSFNAGDFSSSDVAREFEEKFGEPVKLSTISTYLSRLADREYLRREKFGNSWVYRRAYLKIGQASEK